MILLGEFFSGVGSQAMALRDLGADFKTDFTCEWEVNAIASYKAIHFPDDNTDYSEGLSKDDLVAMLYGLGISNDGKNPMPMESIARKNEAWLRETYNNIKATKNLVNIMAVHGWDLIKELPRNAKRWWTYSFPCQDLSVAGLGRGMSKGSGTRSGLLWELERILTEMHTFGGKLPDVLIMENVPQVHGKNNIDDFNSWLSFLESIGYHNFYQDLNAKDYGVAQSRNRCFCISLLDDREYVFPTPFELTKTMEDYLEDDVPEKYYVTSDKAWELINKLVVDGKIPLDDSPDYQEMAMDNLEKGDITAAAKNLGIDEGVLDEEMMNLLMGESREEILDDWMHKVENYDLIEKAADAIVKDSDYSLAAKVLGTSEYEICECVIKEGSVCTLGEEVLEALVARKKAEVLLGVSPTR